MKVDDVLEVCLYADDLPATAEFYEEVLGLEPISRSGDRHAFFRCGRQVVLIFNPERTRAGGEVPAHGADGSGHIAFQVEESDLSRWRAHLNERGVPVEAEVEWPRGGRSIYLRDPAGNSVELAPRRIWGL
jgi:catechol 2,3-dioxygenase-like lactoylglutathione lyase family enzyme